MKTWALWQPRHPPHLLNVDQSLLARDHLRNSPGRDWKSVFSRDDFDAPRDRKLHLNLLPQPFCGDLLHAKVYVLLLNPGVGPTDYFGEVAVPKYRRALRATLRQDFKHFSTPSVQLARRFVIEFVVPRVRHGEAIAIVTRKSRFWKLPRCSGVIRYKGGETRSAHLSPNSRGGKAILRYLAKVLR